MSCDLCNKEGRVVLAKIEGVAYSVCEQCASYGSIIQTTQKKKKRVKSESNEIIRSDAASRIRLAREQKNKTQKDFAQQLQVKESVLQSWESGSRTPTIDAAKKIEKLLGISLLEEPSDVNSTWEQESTRGLTIGDLLKRR